MHSRVLHNKLLDCFILQLMGGQRISAYLFLRRALTLDLFIQKKCKRSEHVANAQVIYSYGKIEMLLKKTSFSYLIATCILASTSGVSAQNVTPSTVNNLNTNVIQIGSQYNISGGTQAGANLFYSLQKLGLSSGEIANFLSNSSVQNILTRVGTGQLRREV
jgi:hypothetical protein